MNKSFALPSKSPIKSFTSLKNIVSEKEHGFTLIEIIIVIIIVGILAAVGISQYSITVEKGRTAEAKARIGTMRQLAYQYYLENGSMAGIQYADVGVDYTCAATDFYRYYVYDWTAGYGYLGLGAERCTSGGKTPNASRAYRVYMQFYPSTGKSTWHCWYLDNTSPCFGMPIYQ